MIVSLKMNAASQKAVKLRKCPLRPRKVVDEGGELHLSGRVLLVQIISRVDRVSWVIDIEVAHRFSGQLDDLRAISQGVYFRLRVHHNGLLFPKREFKASKQVASL